MASVSAENVRVDFPIYHGNSRSLKRTVFAAASGRMKEDAKNRIVVQALGGISFRLGSGERLGEGAPGRAVGDEYIDVLQGGETDQGLLVELRRVRQQHHTPGGTEDGGLDGSLVDVLRNGAPTALIALAMTLVIATRGIDLSVGASVAISGAVACTWIAGSPDPTAPGTAVVART